MAGCGSPPSKKRSTCDVGCGPFTFFQMGTHACQCDHQPNYCQCHGPANIAITAGIAANLRWTAESRLPPISSHEPTSISYLIGKSPHLDRFARDARSFEISSNPSQNVPISSPSCPNRETEPPMDSRYAPLEISMNIRSLYLSDERQKVEILHPTPINSPPPSPFPSFTLHSNHRLRTHLHVENHHINR
jgi:hypothetical protein